MGKVTSLLFNTLSRIVIDFPQMKFNFMTAVTITSDFGVRENKVCHYFHCSPSFWHQVIGLDAMILGILMLSFKSAFTLLFHLHQEAL